MVRNQLIRRQIKDIAQSRKAARNVQTRLSRINKRKYYGTGVEIKSYKDVIRDSADLAELKQALNQFEGREVENTRVAESIIDTLLSKAGDLIQFEAVRESVEDIFSRTFEKGTNRVFDADGEKVDTPETTSKQRLNTIISEQEMYFQNINEGATEKVRQEIQRGFDQGLGTDEIAEAIEDKVSALTRNRANTIARSEVIKASSEGTKASMDAAGIDRVMWLATMDNRTRESHPDGGGCVALHETVWDRESAPTPVEDTHPNCRCTLVMAPDQEE